MKIDFFINPRRFDTSEAGHFEVLRVMEGKIHVSDAMLFEASKALFKADAKARQGVLVDAMNIRTTLRCLIHIVVEQIGKARAEELGGNLDSVIVPKDFIGIPDESKSKSNVFGRLKCFEYLKLHKNDINFGKVGSAMVPHASYTIKLGAQVVREFLNDMEVSDYVNQFDFAVRAPVEGSERIKFIEHEKTLELKVQCIDVLETIEAHPEQNVNMEQSLLSFLRITLSIVMGEYFKEVAATLRTHDLYPSDLEIVKRIQQQEPFKVLIPELEFRNIAIDGQVVRSVDTPLLDLIIEECLEGHPDLKRSDIEAELDGLFMNIGAAMNVIKRAYGVGFRIVPKDTLRDHLMIVFGADGERPYRLHDDSFSTMNVINLTSDHFYLNYATHVFDQKTVNDFRVKINDFEERINATRTIMAVGANPNEMKGLRARIDRMKNEYNKLKYILDLTIDYVEAKAD